MRQVGYLPYGTPEAGRRCNFRMVTECRRAVVVTIGEYRPKGKLTPVTIGFLYQTLALPPEDPDQEEGGPQPMPLPNGTAASNYFKVATEQHFAMCEYFDRPHEVEPAAGERPSGDPLDEGVPV